MVRNFGKKMQTIFKKGLSLSIAMALGVAATSLNLAKTADAAVTEGTVRKVYLKGEKLSADGLDGDTVTHFIMGADDGDGTAIEGLPVVEKSGSVVFKAQQTTGGAFLKVDYTVYDWADVYKGTSVTAAHDTVHDTARDAIVNELSLSGTYHVFRDYLKTCELQLVDGAKKIDKVSYASHDDKDVQLKSPNGDFVYKLGKLKVTREVAKVEMVHPVGKFGYVRNSSVDFTGLKVNVTYNDGKSEEIAFSDANKDKFVFHYTVTEANATVEKELKQGDRITANIEGLVLYYDNVKIANAEAAKFNLYICNENATKRFGSVAVTGAFVKDAVLTVTELKADTETYKKLAAQAGSAKILGAFNVYMDPPAWVGSPILAVYVGTERVGQKATLIGYHSDGTFDSYSDVVDKDGWIHIQHGPVGVFMVVEGEVTAGGSTSEAGKDAGAKTEDTSKDAGSKSEGGSSKSGGSVKTGDNAVVVMSSLALVALLSYVALVLLKKKSGANA